MNVAWDKHHKHKAEGGIAQPFGAPSGFSESQYAIQVQIVAPSLVSWGLQRLVQTAGSSVRLVGVSHTLADALPLIERSGADVVLLDLDDGYGPDHVADLAGRLRAKVLVLTCVGDAGLLGRVLAAGAGGIFRKHEPPTQLLRAVEMVAMGEVFPSGALLHRPQIPPQLAPAVPPLRRWEPEDSKLSSLTKRERQTIAAVVADASAPAKVIAARLGISEHTLRNHLTSIYSKLEVSGRLGLQAFAMQQQGLGRRPC